MKKILLVMMLFLGAKVCIADQLAVISLDEAKKATAYLSTQKAVVLWCGCCDENKKELIFIEKVYYTKEKNYNYCQVIIEGKNLDGKSIKEEVDLAYVHSLEDGLFKSVGTILDFDCDPCTEPFELKDKKLMLKLIQEAKK